MLYSISTYHRCDARLFQSSHKIPKPQQQPFEQIISAFSAFWEISTNSTNAITAIVALIPITLGERLTLKKNRDFQFPSIDFFQAWQASSR